jgi:predicted PhzF superfamily epimerase YddE/YHI9
LTGNPLCVFEQGAEFDAATMQALARQFNLSETTFIDLAPRTCAGALGLGGNALKLDMKAGIIAVEADGDRWTLLEISQGEFAGRPSTLYLEVTADRRIRVGGDVIEVGAGSITL